MARVLIADDDDLLIELVTFTLESRGHEVVTADDGDLAIERAQAERPDLIVLDGMMPGRDGLEVLRELRQDRELANVPVIMLSARKQERDVVGGLAPGRRRLPRQAVHARGTGDASDEGAARARRLMQTAGVVRARRLALAVLGASLLLAGTGGAASAGLDEIKALRDAGRFEEALVVVGERRASFPGDADLALFQGQLLGYLGRYDEALAALAEAEALAPDYADVHRAQIRIRFYRASAATPIEDGALLPVAGSPDANAYVQGRLAFRTGLHPEARAAFEHAVANEPAYAEGVAGARRRRPRTGRYRGVARRLRDGARFARCRQHRRDASAGLGAAALDVARRALGQRQPRRGGRALGGRLCQPHPSFERWPAGRRQL